MDRLNGERDSQECNVTEQFYENHSHAYGCHSEPIHIWAETAEAE